MTLTNFWGCESFPEFVGHPVTDTLNQRYKTNPTEGYSGWGWHFGSNSYSSGKLEALQYDLREERDRPLPPFPPTASRQPEDEEPVEPSFGRRRRVSVEVALEEAIAAGKVSPRPVQRRQLHYALVKEPEPETEPSIAPGTARQQSNAPSVDADVDLERETAIDFQEKFLPTPPPPLEPIPTLKRLPSGEWVPLEEDPIAPDDPQPPRPLPASQLPKPARRLIDNQARQEPRKQEPLDQKPLYGKKQGRRLHR